MYIQEGAKEGIMTHSIDRYIHVLCIVLQNNMIASVKRTRERTAKASVCASV